MRRVYNAKGPLWEELFGDYTADIVDVCHDFAKEAVTSAPFSIVLGESNSDLVRRLLEDDEDPAIETVSLRVPFKVYGRDPCLVVRKGENVSGIIMDHDEAPHMFSIYLFKAGNEELVEKLRLLQKKDSFLTAIL